MYIYVHIGFKTPCGNGWSPKNIHSLEPGNKLPYMAKGTLQIWLRLMTLRWGDCPELSGWSPSDHCDFKSRGESQESRSERCEMRRTLKLEEGGYEPRNVVTSRNWEESSTDSQQKMGLQSYNPKKLNSANKLTKKEMKSLQKGMHPANTLVLV